MHGCESKTRSTPCCHCMRVCLWLFFRPQPQHKVPASAPTRQKTHTHTSFCFLPPLLCRQRFCPYCAGYLGHNFFFFKRAVAIETAPPPCCSRQNFPPPHCRLVHLMIRLPAVRGRPSPPSSVVLHSRQRKHHSLTSRPLETFTAKNRSCTPHPTLPRRLHNNHRVFVLLPHAPHLFFHLRGFGSSVATVALPHAITALD